MNTSDPHVWLDPTLAKAIATHDPRRAGQG